MLSQYGVAAIVEAADGEEALALLGGEIPDCIITDMDMPKLDGLGLLQAIRNGHKSVAKNIKVILLTGHSDLERVGPAIALGVDGLLLKPTSREALDACLRRAFEVDSVASTGTAPSSHREGSGNDGIPTSTGPQEGAERLVAIADVPADAELARDVLFGNGRLLLHAGFRISPRIKDSLAELVAMTELSSKVWIRVS